MSELENLTQLLCRKACMLASAESCTGGMLSALLTDLPGSSAWFERGFVTYSNQAKIDMLHVPAQLIQTNGAVSEAVAQAMAEGALNNSQAQLAVSITGIAGPGGGSLEKPVGTVCFAVAGTAMETLVKTHIFREKNRSEIRSQSCQFALQLIHDVLQ